RRRHTRSKRDWSSDVCSSDLVVCAECEVHRMPTTEEVIPNGFRDSRLIVDDQDPSRLMRPFRPTPAPRGHARRRTGFPLPSHIRRVDCKVQEPEIQLHTLTTSKKC